MADIIFGQMPIGPTEQIDRGCNNCGFGPTDGQAAHYGEPISLRYLIGAAVLSGDVGFI